MEIAVSSPASTRLPGLGVAAITSVGAGAIHAAAVGIHAEHAQLARIFVTLAAAQLIAGLWALRAPGRLAAVTTAAVNAVAVAGWLLTRVSGVSFVEGLETREAAQFADTACALLGALAVGGALAALLVGARPASAPRLALPSMMVAVLAVPAMWTGGTHVHSGDHGHSATETAAGADHGDDHPHDTTATGDTTADHAHDTTWPRPWDPALPFDFSGVEGVSAEQQARAEALTEATQRELPKWADTATAVADGFRSIGDASTGSEHYVKYEYINDEHFLDPRYPESLVYTVDGDRRILAGAMFIASARPTDDQTLTDFAGALMTWHNHGDLCWDLVNGVPSVVGTTRATGTCERGINTGGENPMVHVWIVPHQCGPFAALEGVGMGQAAVSEDERVDLCHSDHHDDGHGDSTTPKPYDPTQPIDLSGMPGVTPEQQAAAENLIAITLIRLPQWADYRVAEAAGFHSIRDAATGYEHFINWDWINDDVWLNPDFPESLVYQPQPDGSRQLVSAMYMLPDNIALDDVPNIGGDLMQWHIHDNLCFTTDPVAPIVAGLTSPDGSCANGLVKFAPAPMIHVWIVPHTCGPFAALEGLGAGQILEGEERLCDHLHGSGI
ncbi:MAG: hypothetical protein ACKOAZ_11760 [Ilumatobacteraceae bacterium]